MIQANHSLETIKAEATIRSFKIIYLFFFKTTYTHKTLWKISLKLNKERNTARKKRFPINRHILFPMRREYKSISR